MAEREKDEFWCPRCGSHNFATLSDGHIRVCQGASDGNPCDFTWDATDDARWGLRPVRPPTPVDGDSYAVALERALRERNALCEQVTRLQAECTRLEETVRALRPPPNSEESAARSADTLPPPRRDPGCGQ